METPKKIVKKGEKTEGAASAFNASVTVSKTRNLGEGLLNSDLGLAVVP